MTQEFRPQEFMEGDIVIFKAWDEMLSEYGYDSNKECINVPLEFIQVMKKYFDHEFEVRDVIWSEHYECYQYFLKYLEVALRDQEIDHCISGEMLKAPKIKMIDSPSEYIPLLVTDFEEILVLK